MAATISISNETGDTFFSLSLLLNPRYYYLSSAAGARTFITWTDYCYCSLLKVQCEWGPAAIAPCACIIYLAACDFQHKSLYKFAEVLVINEQMTSIVHRKTARYLFRCGLRAFVRVCVCGGGVVGLPLVRQMQRHASHHWWQLNRFFFLAPGRTFAQCVDSFFFVFVAADAHSKLKMAFSCAGFREQHEVAVLADKSANRCYNYSFHRLLFLMDFLTSFNWFMPNNTYFC